MFRITEPSDEDVAKFISSQRNLDFTYPEVGATNATPPAGFTVDHNRIQLGTGEATYARAVEALKKWRQFELGWVTIVPRGVAVEVGATVAVRARAYGTWSLSASRVVYVIDESRRFGFAYGTLPDHVECGEERFLVEWLEDDSVWYDIFAFSKPRHPLVRLTSPLARVLQKRFARESLRKLAADERR
ncbi:MAG TPA: DUF1990 domain-containing protein [Candidatus Polarisedimenticolaceae bacterium]|nr:DUF1990 domain-containing protein [Candidatus Polarisedimenticolaceae bacterium]